MDRCNVIVFPPYAQRLKLLELIRWAHSLDCSATIRDCRSGNSFVTLEPLTPEKLRHYEAMLRTFQ